MLLQSKFEERNLACLVVSEQPVVGITAIVSVEHDSDVVIDRVAVLHGFTRAEELRFAGWIERSETGNRRFSNHDPG